MRPALGRDFRDQEEQAGKNFVAILKDGLWRRRFHADPAVVGRTLTLNGLPHTVVGILAPGLVGRMKRPKSAMLFVVQQGVGFIPVPGVGLGFAAMSSLVEDPEFSARATALLVLPPEPRSQRGDSTEQSRSTFPERRRQALLAPRAPARRGI